MRNKLSYFFISLFLILGSSATFGQINLLDSKDLSQVKIDSYSDADIKKLYEKLEKNNISEEKAYAILSEKGLADIEIEKLRTRISRLSNMPNAEQDNSFEYKKSEDDKIIQQKYSIKEDKEKSSAESEIRNNLIFGSELFNKSSNVFEPNLRIATPSSYVLGPDDEIILNVFGFSEKRYNLQVNQEGEIYIPNVGPIFVNGLTIDQATKKITNKLGSTIYSAIKSGKTSVQLTLGKIRSIRVTVIGEATKPGTYTVSSLTTLFNILYLCGGPGDKGSYRKIELIRGNKIIREIDLYAFLIKGNQSDNVLLEEGDLIRIPYCTNRVTIKGNVRRIGLYEMTEKDSLPSLLLYCGGFTDDAYRELITVSRISAKQKEMIDLNQTQYALFKPQSGDVYSVYSISNIFSNKISIGGSVVRPGSYELNNNLQLLQAIEKAGGLTEDAFTKWVTIFRYFENKTPTTVSINIDSLHLHHTDFPLIKNDSIYVRSVFDVRENQTVTIEGFVNKPGEYVWRDNLTLGDLLLIAGGINSKGDSSKIEISRVHDKSEKKLGSFKETELFIISTINNGAQGSQFVLKPFDIVSVKNLPGVVNQRSVVIVGDVVVPGRFILESSNDCIGDVIKRADGLRYSKDSSFIFIRRPRNTTISKKDREQIYSKLLGYSSDSLKSYRKIKEELDKEYDVIGVDMNTLDNNKSGSNNVQLMDGDMVFVKRLSNLVKVSGEVSYPNIVNFVPNKRLKYYIKKAGGFLSSAKKANSIVIYRDGSAKGIKKILGFNRYPKVTADAEVFVPTKDKSGRTKISLSEMAILISALGVIANMIVTLKK